MGITYVSSAIAASNTLTMPSHQSGDLLIAVAHRLSSSTAPDAGAGWSSTGTRSSGTSNATRYGAKVAASSSETFGTWTNAAYVMVLVYRPGAGETWLTDSGETVPLLIESIGSNGNSTAITWTSGMFLKDTPDNYTLIRYATHNVATNLNTPALAGWNDRVGAAIGMRAWDSGTTEPVGVFPTDKDVGDDTFTVNTSGSWNAVAFQIGTTVASLPTFDLKDDFSSTPTNPNYNVFGDGGGVSIVFDGSVARIDHAAAAELFLTARVKQTTTMNDNFTMASDQRIFMQVKNFAITSGVPSGYSAWICGPQIYSLNGGGIAKFNFYVDGTTNICYLNSYTGAGRDQLFTFNSSVHKWISLRASTAGVVTWETSTDGINWTVLDTVTESSASWAGTRYGVWLFSGSNVGGVDLQVDNFGITPSSSGFFAMF